MVLGAPVPGPIAPPAPSQPSAPPVKPGSLAADIAILKEGVTLAFTNPDTRGAAIMYTGGVLVVGLGLGYLLGKVL